MRLGLQSCATGPNPGQQDNSNFDIVFGKPAAPKELYERIATDSRRAMMALAAGPDSEFDLVLASLHLSSEDDAIKTKTHIPLPVEAFSQRVDDMVKDCTRRMRAPVSEGGLGSNVDDRSRLAYCCDYLFAYWGLKIASAIEDGAFSPYRVYINNVITQRCGTPSSSAALLSTFLLRLTRPGQALEGISDDISIGLPSSPGSVPTAALKTDEDKQSSLVQWITKQQLLADQLDSLKRFFWGWPWALGAQSGFEACARSLLGESGRAGLVNAAVGVMQPQGRPFGNVELSVLATERAAQITALIDDDGWEFATHLRDLGALNIHIGKRSLGLAQLECYKSWLEGLGALSLAAPSSAMENAVDPSGSAPGSKVGEERTSAPGAFHALVSEVILVQRRKLLDSTFSDNSTQSPTEFLPTDD